MWQIDIENIGGIRAGSTTIGEGLNVVKASNFRGKSSLVAAVRTAIGATGQYGPHPLREGPDSGQVTLDNGTDTYEVTLERTDSGTIARSGTPYLTDETEQVSVRLFSFLGEDNPIRATVRNGGDLTPLLQAPLDIADIDQRISSLHQEKGELETKIEDTERAASRLPAIQQDVTQLEETLSELRSRQESVREEDDNRQQVETLTEELGERTGELERVKGNVRQFERQMERKQAKLSDKRTELDTLSEPEETITDVDVEAKREHIDRLDSQLRLVEDLRRANQQVLEEGELHLVTDVEHTVEGDEVECWVCGHRSKRKSIADRLSSLGTKQRAIQSEKSDLEDELETYEQQQREIQEVRRKREQLEREIGQLQRELDELEADLTAAENRQESLAEEITDIRGRIEATEEEYNEELTDIKTEIRTKEMKLAEKRETLEDLEETREGLTELQERHDELTEQIADLRAYKRTTHEDLRDEFNTALSDIISRFEPGFSDARLVLKTDTRGDVEEIDLRIAREVDGGGRETSVDSLSEGEVELVGIAVALAGYRAFDVDEFFPLLLFDGLGQLAAEHLRTLIDYLEDSTDVLVTTAYPEAGEFDGNIIRPDEWDVVSDSLATT